MFKNSSRLIFLGVETLPKKQGGTYQKITFANPVSYDKFSLFLPEDINPYESGISNGSDVVIEVSITQDGYNLRTDLKTLETAKPLLSK